MGEVVHKSYFFIRKVSFPSNTFSLIDCDEFFMCLNSNIKNCSLGGLSYIERRSDTLRTITHGILNG